MGRKAKDFWVETGKGSIGSIFVKGEMQVRAKRVGKTLGGLQIWNLFFYAPNKPSTTKTVYLKSRRELKQVLERLF